jgi:hypothetical protein
MFSISSITKVFKCFGVYKRYLDPLNVTLLHLYFQNYIIMEEMERMINGEDPNSLILPPRSASELKSVS